MQSRLKLGFLALVSIFVCLALITANTFAPQVNRAAAAPPPKRTPTPTAPTATPIPLPPSSTRIVGYYTSWSVYQRDFHVSEIDASRLTHINYAFANIDGATGKCAIGDQFADVGKAYPGDQTGDGHLRGNFNQLRQLKLRYPHLKVMISVGGWTWSEHFSDVALTAASRQAFVQSCIDLFIKGQYGTFGTVPGIFDGIDVDWEYPVGGGLYVGRPEDKHNYTLLMQEFRTQLNALTTQTGKTYELSIAAGAGPSVLANMEASQLAATLDFINIMSYDYHGSWEMVTNFNAPMYFSSTDPSEDPVNFNVHQSIQNYLNAGVPASKLVLGIPFYGKSWTRVQSPNNGLYQTAGRVGPGTWENGILDYSAIRTKYEPTYPKFRHPEAQVPWLYNGTVFISYDDPQAITMKANYIRANNLGGAMFWELSGDVQGVPAPSTSLLYALYNGLNP